MAKKKRKSTAYQLERQRHWKAIIAKWKQSGLSQAVFCRRHKLQMQQFSKWKIRLAKRSTTASKPAIRSDFIEIKPSVSDSCIYEIITPGDYRIRVGEGYHPEVLSGLLSVVSQSC